MLDFPGDDIKFFLDFFVLGMVSLDGDLPDQAINLIVIVYRVMPAGVEFLGCGSRSTENRKP